jgi:ADP-L-glycero-D-manno-heptose 6-epimerase
MKILLTGYKGFIGSHMLTALADHDVTPIEWSDGIPNLAYYDWVIHMGAISSTTETDIEKIMAQNVDYSMDLYDQCRKYNVNFQFSSSASLYGLKQDFRESAPVDPRTPYAWSKYMVERYIARNASTAYTQVFRYFNVYGPNEDHKGKQASPYNQFPKQLKEFGHIKLFENSANHHRDFVPVSTVIDIQKRFLTILKSGLWNIGTGETKSFEEVAKSISNRIEYIPMPEQLKNSYQKYTCADLTHLKETIHE